MDAVIPTSPMSRLFHWCGPPHKATLFALPIAQIKMNIRTVRWFHLVIRNTSLSTNVHSDVIHTVRIMLTHNYVFPETNVKI